MKKLNFADRILGGALLVLLLAAATPQYLSLAGGAMRGALHVPSVNGFIYVDGTTYGYNETGLRAALAAAGSASTTVYLGPGTVTVTTGTVKIPANVVLKGAGQQNTKILAGGGFPTNTPLTQLGCAGSPCENTINGTRIESMTLDCGSITSCTGAYTNNANEDSGWIDVTVHSAPKYGFWIDGTHHGDTGNPTPGHWMLRDATVCCTQDVTGIYAVDADLGRLTNITINTPNATNGIEASSDNANFCTDLQIVGQHIEGGGITDNIYVHASAQCGTSNRIALWGGQDTGSGTNALHVGTLWDVVDIGGNYETNGTNIIKNDVSGTTIPVSSQLKNFYHFAKNSSVAGFDEIWQDINGLYVNGVGITLTGPASGLSPPISFGVGTAGKWQIGGGFGGLGDDSWGLYSVTYGPSHSFHAVLACNSSAACQFPGAVTAASVGTGSSIVYRCTTGGTLPVGALTTVTGSCGASVDSGLRTQ